MAAQLPSSAGAYAPPACPPLSDVQLYVQSGETFLPLAQRLPKHTLDVTASLSTSSVIKLGAIEETLTAIVNFEGQEVAPSLIPGINDLLSWRFSLISPSPAGDGVLWTTTKTEYLGRGVSGAVLKLTCNDSTTVAIKLAQPGKGLDEDLAKEAWILSKLNELDSPTHPRIVRLLSYGTIGKCSWITMPALTQTLSNAICSSTLTLAKIFRVTCSILEGLKLLQRVKLGDHEGVVHCDLKPGNILLDENDNAKICDFGLTCFADQLPRAGRIITRWYRAPEATCHLNEQRLPAEPHSRLSPSLDMWSLAVIIYEMLMKGKILWPGRDNYDQWKLIADSLGKAPAELRANNTNLQIVLDSPGPDGLCRPKHWKKDLTPHPNWLEKRLELNQASLQQPKLLKLAELLKSTFRWMPEDRPTATEALEWLQSPEAPKVTLTYTAPPTAAGIGSAAAALPTMPPEMQAEKQAGKRPATSPHGASSVVGDDKPATPVNKKPCTKNAAPAAESPSSSSIARIID